MYANGEERDDEQMAEYRARTLILRDDITEGKATLRIYDVRASDRGSYRCYFQGENFSENAVMELKVAVAKCPCLMLMFHEIAYVQQEKVRPG